MRKLSIGELAGLLGVPPSTMRFYESKGIVAPGKDSRNSYRTYTTPESHRILLSRLYQSFGFSLAETAELLSRRDHEGLVSALAEREAGVDEELARLEAMRAELELYRRDCLSLGSGGGGAPRFETVEFPAMDYVFTIRNGSPDCDEERASIAREWMGDSPLPAFYLLIPEGAFLGDEAFSTRWGFGLESGRRKPARAGFIESYPGGEALAATFLRERTARLDREELAPIIDAFKATGREMAGPVRGRFLEIIDAGEKELYFYRLYIPVKRNR